jgi:multiple sugar transport system substrate-binding protein
MEILAAETPESAALYLQSEMERFGRDKGQPIKVSQFSWDNIWRELVNVGIYRRGPDIAEIGSTWLDGLVAMQSLNSFSARDIYQIGGQETFLPAAWQNVDMPNKEEVWGIPFRVDTRVMFYWKDQYEAAAVDPAQAFSSIDEMTASFAKMQAAGIPAWIAPTNSAHNTVYNMASWIWGAGGQFLSDDGKKTTLDTPAARHGIQSYFNLLRFMPKQTSPFSDHDALQLFFARKAASIVGGPWLLSLLRLRSDAAELFQRLGVALLPGPAFVGGTLLVTWKHSKYVFEPLDLIRRLTSVEFQSKYCPGSGMLPVRQDLWTDEFIHSDAYMPVFHQSILSGRGLHPIPLWGIVEDHLSNTMGAIWRDLYALNMPGLQIPNLDEVVARRLDALSVGLDLTLSVSNEPHDDMDDYMM